MMRTPRDYQTECIAAVDREFERVNSTLAVMATGLGKTVVMSEVAKHRSQFGAVLMLAHRVELLDQAAKHFSYELGYTPEVIQATREVDWHGIGSGRNVIVGSVQTLRNPKRLDRMKKYGIGTILIDEAHHACFPAGTLVDGMPIESIKAGSLVNSLNHETGLIEKRTVTATSKRPAGNLVIVHMSNGSKITCTPNHPFFTAKGQYSEAALLHPGDMVYCTTKHPRSTSNASDDFMQSLQCSISSQEQEWIDRIPSGMLLRKVQGGIVESEVDGSRFAVQKLRSACRVQRTHTIGYGSPWISVLLRTMQKRILDKCFVGDNGQNKSKICVCENEEKQSDGKARIRCQNGKVHARQNVPFSRRKWQDYPTTRIACERAFTADGIPNTYSLSEIKIQITPTLLQGGRSGPTVEVGNRGRREISPAQTVEVFGPPKDRGIECVRVDCVEILESGNRQRFERLCPDGSVYNLEVDGNHNYFANGILVHNCARSYKQIVDFFRGENPNLKTLGVTATPKRTDKKALGIVFDSVAFQMEASDGIKKGWLVEPVEERVIIDNVDFGEIPITFNELGEPDFSPSALESLMIEEGPLHAVATPTIAKSDGRSVLVFTAGVAHAHLLAAILNRLKPESAAAIDGKTTPPGHPERERIMTDFRKGKIQYVCNFGLLTEGTDVPSCDMVVVARPTKSVLILTQMVGRGLRPLPGIVDGHTLPTVRRAAIAESAKPTALILYFSPKAANIKTATTYDALGGNYDDDVVALAKEMDSEEPGKKVTERLEEAALIYPVIAQNRLRKKIKAEVEWRTESVGNNQNSANHDTANINRGGATDKQIEALIALGVSYQTAAAYTAKQAWAVTDKLRAERCTIKQRRLLEKFGEDPNVNYAKAREKIDAIAKNGWKPL